MATRQPNSRGRLVLNVAEASGRTQEDQVVWDQSFVEGFVKVEVRGDARTVKVASRPMRIISHSINWNEELSLEVLEGARELRLMLCREKRTESRTSTSVVAACGIFIEDILNAVPIDKYFELFKPGAAGPGGFIRISMVFEPASSTPYHSPAEDMRSTHSTVSDTSYQDIPMVSSSGHTTPRGIADGSDDTGSVARRITEEAFQNGLGADHATAAANADPHAATENTPAVHVDFPDKAQDFPADGPAPKRHGFRWVLVAGIIAAGAYAIKTFVVDRQQTTSKK